MYGPYRSRCISMHDSDLNTLNGQILSSMTAGYYRPAVSAVLQHHRPPALQQRCPSAAPSPVNVGHSHVGFHSFFRAAICFGDVFGDLLWDIFGPLLMGGIMLFDIARFLSIHYLVFDWKWRKPEFMILFLCKTILVFTLPNLFVHSSKIITGLLQNILHTLSPIEHVWHI